MTRTFRNVLVAAPIAGIAVAVACTATANNRRLNAKYEYTVGDDIALRTSNIFRIAAGIVEPTLVYYDREKQDIVAETIGNTDNVEGAKREIQGLIDVIQSDVVRYAKRQHRLDLTPDDVTFIYYVDSDQGVPEEVVRREKGRFVVPKFDEGKD